jgi:hypothetical protein
MHRVAAKFVPLLLTDEQKGPRVAMSQELLHRANDGHTAVIPQPPYSLDLAPADFFLFPS